MSALDEIAAERARQDARWGEQNHTDGTGPHRGLGLAGWAPTYPEWRDRIRETVNTLAERDDSQWALILLEEVFEALAEADPTTVRAELVQVAAVAAQWIEAIDRRTTQ